MSDIFDFETAYCNKCYKYVKYDKNNKCCECKNIIKHHDFNIESESELSEFTFCKKCDNLTESFDYCGNKFCIECGGECICEHSEEI